MGVIGKNAPQECTDMLKKIKLYGDLAEKFGYEFELAVRTPAEAIKALCANFPKMKQHLQSDTQGYIVKVEGTSKDVEGLFLPIGSRETLHIIPNISGAGKTPGVNIIIGAVLIYAGVMFAGGPTNPVGSFLINAGASMIFAGVAALLFAPSERVPDANDKNKPSYQFNGVVNTTKEGYPVPIGYGELIVGSAIISGGLNTHDF